MTSWLLSFTSCARKGVHAQPHKQKRKGSLHPPASRRWLGRAFPFLVPHVLVVRKGGCPGQAHEHVGLSLVGAALPVAAVLFRRLAVEFLLGGFVLSRFALLVSSRCRFFEKGRAASVEGVWFSSVEGAWQLLDDFHEVTHVLCPFAGVLEHRHVFSVKLRALTHHIRLNVDDGRLEDQVTDMLVDRLHEH